MMTFNEQWPLFENVPNVSPEVCKDELKSKVVANTSSSSNLRAGGIGEVIDCKCFSCLKKLLSVSVYVLRFVKNMKAVLTGSDRVTGEINLVELYRYN